MFAAYKNNISNNPPLSEPTNLDGLRTEQARELSIYLKEVLDEWDYNYLNYMTRGDYSSSPLPFLTLNAIKSDNLNLLMDERDVGTVSFFLLGEAIDEALLEKSLRPHGKKIIELGFETGLFERHEDKIRLAGLVLCSQDLDRETIYFFVDPPKYYPSWQQTQRVYIGPDSYNLSARLNRIDSLDGFVAEGGSGSGYQLIRLLKKHPNIQVGFGLEIDQRALNVSHFNAVLNGVEDRFFATDSADSLGLMLSGEKLSLVISNPPFLPAPELIPLPDNDREIRRLFSILPASAFTPNNSAVFMQSITSTAGWGGQDGLSVIKLFLNAFNPHISNKGSILLSGQFAGANDIPTLLEHSALSTYGLTLNFEKYPQPYAHFSLESWAYELMKLAEHEYPNLKGLKFTNSIPEIAMRSLGEIGVTHVYSGYAHLSEANHNSVTRLTSAPKHPDPFNYLMPTNSPLIQSATVIPRWSD